MWRTRHICTKFQENRPAVCVPLRGNGNGTGSESMRVMDRVMPIIKIWEHERNRESCYEKICWRQLAIFFLTIASESEKVFARILDEHFRCLDLPKICVFSRRTIQNFMTLTPPLVFWNWESFHSLTKKISWCWQSILRYTNVYILYLTMWLMREYLYYRYIYM